MKQRIIKSPIPDCVIDDTAGLIGSDHDGKLIREAKNGKVSKELVSFDALPEYMKDNEFIRNHYRCQWPLKDVALSIFSVHNETLNIWTHLVGFLIFAGLTAMSLTDTATVENLIGTCFRGAAVGPLKTVTTDKSDGSLAFFLGSYLRHIPVPTALGIHEDSNDIPKWPWFVFLGGAMCCLVCSSISHLFACHSKQFYLFFWRLDYAGISVMIVCSFFAPVYYTFSCHPISRFLYLTSITSVGVLATIILLAPASTSGRFRSFRTTLFLVMGFSGVIPAAHALILYRGNPQIPVALGYEIVMGLLYAVGAGFYVSRIPERWKPGAFDIVGQSHQIFHALVVAAALTHCAATLEIMDWNRGVALC